MFQRKPPLEVEWDKLLKKEQKFISVRKEKKESFLNQKLEERVPEKLQHTLDAAFEKAFTLIFEKGTGIIEKTYNKEEMEKRYQIDEFADQIQQNRKSLKTFSKKANKSGRTNLLMAGTAGIGMGALGIGIPDIPVFTGMLLKSIYEISIHYGFRYETEEEKYFIMLLIQGAVSYGDKIEEINAKINRFIITGNLPVGYEPAVYIKETAACLSKELLYMKFIQGIPVLGVVGGVYDAVYMKRITEYAGMKYYRRFLHNKKL